MHEPYEEDTGLPLPLLVVICQLPAILEFWTYVSYLLNGFCLLRMYFSERRSVLVKDCISFMYFHSEIQVLIIQIHKS